MTQEKTSLQPARMIGDMRVRGMADESQKAHIRALGAETDKSDSLNAA